MKKRMTRVATTRLNIMPISPVDALLHGVDMVAHAAELRWGVGVLNSMCHPDTAAKFCRAQARLNAAIDTNDYDTVKAAAENIKKGWAKMEEEATASSALDSMPSKIWHYTTQDGCAYAVCQDELTATKFIAENPHMGASTHTVKSLCENLSRQSVIHQKGDYKLEVYKPKYTGGIIEDTIPF